MTLDRDADFNNKALLAGNALKFTSNLHEAKINEGVDMTLSNPNPSSSDNYLIANSTRDSRTTTNINEEVELYNLEVTWFTYTTGTTCSLGPGSSGVVTGADTAHTLQYSATVTGTTVIKNFDDTIDCGGDPVEITGVSTAVTDTWTTGLERFAKLNLDVTGGTGTDADASFDMVENGNAVLTSGSLPIFSNADLRIYGNLPLSNNLLVQVNYLSVPNASCSVK